MKKRILSIGGGNMGRAIVGGLLANGYAPNMIEVVEPDPDARGKLVAELGVSVAQSLLGPITADIILLAVKPQIMKPVVQGLAQVLDGARPLVISIAAGITSTQLAEWILAEVPIVRVMPNTPSLVGCGAAAMYATGSASRADRDAAESIIGAVGIAEWVDTEGLLDAVTALSGSGPAYFFLFMEMLERIAVELGLEKTLARKLAIETAYGSALLARESSETPATLRAQVTSPGGTTASALEVLADGNLEELLRKALSAAHARSRELAVQSGDAR